MIRHGQLVHPALGIRRLGSWERESWSPKPKSLEKASWSPKALKTMLDTIVERVQETTFRRLFGPFLCRDAFAMFGPQRLKARSFLCGFWPRNSQLPILPWIFGWIFSPVFSKGKAPKKSTKKSPAKFTWDFVPKNSPRISAEAFLDKGRPTEAQTKFALEDWT